MNLHLIFLLIISLFNFFLGFVVWQRDKRNINNRAFGILTLTVIFWIISLYFSDLPLQMKYALFLNKLTLVFGIFFVSSFVYFCIIFPSEEKFLRILKWPFLLIIFSSIAIFILIILFTNLIVEKIEFYEWGINIIPGKLYPLVAIYYFGSVIVGIKSLISKYWKSRDIERKQIQFLFFGFLLSATGILTTNLIHPLITGANPYAKYGPYFITFFLIFSTYAIIKHHLFRIRVILTELLVGVMGLILLIQVLIAPSLQWRISTLLAFLLFLIFGYYLIKATHQEEKRREEAEKVAVQEKALRKKIERLARAREQFLLSSQHYFRTPLTSIIGFLDLILAENHYGKIPEKAKEKLKLVLKSVLELRKRIEESLDIGQFQIKKRKEILNLEEVQIEDLLKEAIEELKPQAKEKNLFLEAFFPQKSLPKLKLDKKRIFEVFVNLIDNGIKHTLKGGIKINLNFQEKKNSILVSVRDTGIGIPKEELPFIGQAPFERGEKAKKLTPLGKGIGLYLSRLIIEAHQGKLWAESEGENKGSTFFIELPIKL